MYSVPYPPIQCVTTVPAREEEEGSRPFILLHCCAFRSSLWLVDSGGRDDFYNAYHTIPHSRKNEM